MTEAGRSQNRFLKITRSHADYDGCHRHHVKHYSYPSAHFSQHLPDDRMEWRMAFF